MADMLKFRKGTLAQINSAEKVAGTIYIAKDEKAMYVDVDASTRIRIGDFVRVATVSDIPFPASTSALYYVEADNALLGYDGENWKQINGTKELTDRIAAVEGDIATNKSDISTLKTDVGTLKADVGTLKTDVGTHSSDIEALKAAIGMNEEGEVEGLAGSVAALREDLTELETEVHGTDGNGGMKATLSEYAGRISALETIDVATKTDVANAKTAILGEANYNGTVKGAYEAAAAAQAQADKGVANAATAQSKADANENAISALTNRVTTLDQAGTGKVAVLESKVDTLEKAGYATVTQVNTAKSEVLGTEADAAGAATVHGALKAAAAADAKAAAADEKAAAAQGAINEYKETHASDYTNTKINELVADAKKAGTDAQADIDAWEIAHANDYTNTQIDNYIKVVEDKVDAHTGTLGTLTGAATVTGSVAEAKAAADAAQSDATQALADAAAAQTQADKGVSDAAANAGEITTLKGKVTANEGEIATLKGKVAAIEGDYVTESELATVKGELQQEIDADIRAANAMEYVATIESASELPATAKNGATYVVGSAFGDYAAGDMLIAQGTEDADTGLITNPTWAWVKSGYDASLDQQLTGSGDKIMLSNGTRNDEDAAGSISFVAEGSASVKVSNNTVTMSMVWIDFPEN